ncbi:transcriptional regulator [Labilibaculum manganireducens]|uniref:helix-turn-helix domain-containing protein n=1 Tax=Labilibaculum manganireducens TaxID=1940525 RepID=UPI0029F54AAE|nr:transcriptional regulator [Labilibaculum manganireducens]
MVEVSAIKNDEQLDEALREIDNLIDCNEGSLEEEKLYILSLIVADYEERFHPIGMPHPIKAIELRMEEQHLKLTDLIKLIGEEFPITTVLYRKQKLDLPLIRKLSVILNIPIEILVQEYDL